MIELNYIEVKTGLFRDFQHLVGNNKGKSAATNTGFLGWFQRSGAQDTPTQRTVELRRQPFNEPTAMEEKSLLLTAFMKIFLCRVMYANLSAISKITLN